MREKRISIAVCFLLVLGLLMALRFFQHRPSQKERPSSVSTGMEAPSQPVQGPSAPQAPARPRSIGAGSAPSQVPRQKTVRLRKGPEREPRLSSTGRIYSVAELVPAPLATIELPGVVERHEAMAALPKSQESTDRTPASVQAVMLHGARLLREAYRRQLRADPLLAGRLTVRLTVEPLGRVREVEVLDGDLVGTDFAAQAARLLHDLVFPATPERDGVEAYRQTFVFQPAE
ncbi:MAG: AgmX/PglI C-terminal domain-containing protein [candidate division KSB1 bacterium]|nr:AgmX/PglI C-terminal domain-containing protein [candidate division KSB1 bacterium]